MVFRTHSEQYFSPARPEDESEGDIVEVPWTDVI